MPRGPTKKIYIFSFSFPGSYLDTLKQLETTWMRKYLAKRRWQRWFNTVKAMNRMQRLVHEQGNGAGETERLGLSTFSHGTTPSPQSPSSTSGAPPAKERWV